jgi:transcription antitermination factor NusG
MPDVSPPSPPLPEARTWGAIHTKPRAEKKLAEYLAKKGIPHFLPLLRRKNAGNREVRFFHVPLFPGYVFVDTAAAERKVIFDSRKAAQILEPTDPEALRADLANIALALRADDRLAEVKWAEPGRPVRIVRGSLKGLTGEIVQVQTAARLIVRVHFIGRAACLDIDESLVEPEL